TSSYGDWSSDVCSSDLDGWRWNLQSANRLALRCWFAFVSLDLANAGRASIGRATIHLCSVGHQADTRFFPKDSSPKNSLRKPARSEERRVGKERTTRWR